MVFILNQQNTIGNQYLAELRDVEIQRDMARFRRNQERIGAILAYEISKTFNYTPGEVQTPLGIAEVNRPADLPVLGVILRAGLPLHAGMLNFFDQSPSAFITAYRKNHKKTGSFTISLDHIATPDLNGKTFILCDTMLATGQSVVRVCKELLAQYELKALHVAAVIASAEGIEHVRAYLPNVNLWVGAVDEEMTTRAYIVPGLGDAGDLAYGEKV